MASRNPRAPRLAAAKSRSRLLEASRRIARNVFLRPAPQASKGDIGLDICFVRSISVGALTASGAHKLRTDERAVKEQPCVGESLPGFDPKCRSANARTAGLRLSAIDDESGQISF